MRERKIFPVLLFIVLAMLVFNLGFALYEYLEFQERVQSGNNRWEQVEERIKKIERCCNCGRDS